MDLIQSFATKNPCYKTNKKIKVEGIIVEGVGCPQSSARVFAHNRNRENCEGKCAHAFVDANDGTVIQLLPWDHRGWHCGKHPRTKKNANDTHIGIQLCEPSQIRYKKKNEIELAGDKEKASNAVNTTYKSAVELCTFLCEKFNLDPTIAVISRMEAYDAAIASMQASPEFVWKAVGADFTMDKFRTDVKQRMTENAANTETEEQVKEDLEIGEMTHAGLTKGLASSTETTEPILNIVEFRGIQIEDSADDTFIINNEPILEKKPVENEIEEKVADVLVKTGLPKSEPIKAEEPKLQMVKITVDNLRIRSTPGIGNNATGKFTGKGIFEITEIQNGSGSKTGWGKLSSGAGWVCLDYVTLL